MKEKANYPIFQEIKITKQTKQTQLLFAVYAKQNFEPELKFLFKSDFLKWAVEILSLKCDIKEFYYSFKELVKKGFIREFLKPGSIKSLFGEWNCEILESGLKYLEELFPFLEICSNEEQKSEEIVIFKEEEQEIQTKKNTDKDKNVVKSGVFKDEISEILSLMHRLLAQQTNMYGRLKNIEFEIDGFKEGQKKIIGRVKNAEFDVFIRLRKLLEEITNIRNEIKNRLSNIKQVEEAQKESEELKQELHGVLNELKLNLNNY